MGILFLLFAVMPIVEIALLIQVGDIIGGWNTVAIVIITAFIGAYLVRQEGLSTLQEAQRKMQQGAMPGDEMAQGLFLVIAGVLLVTPGFVTDIIGLLFTFAPTRKLFARALLTKLANSQRVHTHVYTQQSYTQHYQSRPEPGRDSDGDVIEGEYREHQSDPREHIEDFTNDRRDQ
ncbi:FxsA family protein [Alteromonas facilis]|uniref:FxsA family protein n=1 Tax=Alteromonas facilis TaxID=2048004 RepID=UPI000C284BEA|nr:FxsA family protein [Alteromonas facilis]